MYHEKKNDARNIELPFILSIEKYLNYILN